MQHAVRDTKQFRIPAALEQRRVATSVLVDAILVRIQEVQPPVRDDCVSHEQQRMLCNAIVVIDKGDEVAARIGNAGVAGSDDAAVVLPEEADPRLARHRPVQDFGYSGARTAIVDQQKLPIGIALPANRRDRFFEIGRRRIEHRHDDRNARGIGVLHRA